MPSTLGPSSMNYRAFLANPERPCAIVAHCGVWRDAPENSLLAIERAIASGYPVVEIDVRRSVDGQLMLLHDDTLERMAEMPFALEDLPARELARIALRNCRGGAANPTTNEMLPSLAQVFELARDRIYLHLDIKHRGVIEEAIALAAAMGVSGQIDVWADLKSADEVAWVRDVVRPQDIAFITRVRLEQADGIAQLERMFDLRPAVCEVTFSNLADVQLIRERCARANIALWVNTLDSVASAGFTDTNALINPAQVWGALIENGVVAIQTDEMEALATYLQRKE